MAGAFRIGCFMHVPFEGPGVIAEWSMKNGHLMEPTRLYQGDPLPDPDLIDMLVIMGGPMEVYNVDSYPWMERELEWIGDFIAAGKPVLGICLGAQMLASVLGGTVYPGKNKEIGWFNLQFLSAFGDYKICKELPAARKVFHWHGDTFSIPDGAARIAGSKAFPNQGFIFQEKVIALQFHLEVTPEGVRELVKNCRDELVEGPFIQTEKEMLSEKGSYLPNQELIYNLLDYLRGQVV